MRLERTRDSRFAAVSFTAITAGPMMIDKIKGEM
jgi:hypothetical protein